MIGRSPQPQHLPPMSFWLRRWIRCGCWPIVSLLSRVGTMWKWRKERTGEELGRAWRRRRGLELGVLRCPTTSHALLVSSTRIIPLGRRSDARSWFVLPLPNHLCLSLCVLQIAMSSKPSPPSDSSNCSTSRIRPAVQGCLLGIGLYVYTTDYLTYLSAGNPMGIPMCVPCMKICSIDYIRCTRCKKQFCTFACKERDLVHTLHCS
jgi:hypothetical protein